ncbi:MAG: N-acetyl-alpha-D-glucosaminyl L-malate synthase BshA [Planctomycetes bacterium]|nr:N-acetyl-alpha-D-glucosaminyl L-malate synthase BshA [Planctomycetota bacterium]
MRIGIVCYPTHGGSGVVATELGLGLAERGHEVHFIAYDTPVRLPHFAPRVHLHEVEVRPYPLFRHPPYTLALTSKIVDVHERFHLDLVHSHYAVPHAVSVYLAREMVPERPLRVITTLHGTDITLIGMDPSYQRVTCHALERSCAVTAVSQFLRRRAIEECGCSYPIEVIPNFVDTTRFAPGDAAGPRATLAPGGELLIGHLSNFREVKRLPDLVEVFRIVRESVPARLVLVGDGPEMARVERLVDRHGLRDHVVFAGFQDAVEELLRALDLFILPSEHESFGLAALEAMACAVPVIATGGSGLDEVIQDGVSGLLFPVGDVRAMASHAVRLLTDAPARRAMGASARGRAVEAFPRARIITQYEEFYRRVLASPARASPPCDATRPLSPIDRPPGAG